MSCPPSYSMSDGVMAQLISSGVATPDEIRGLAPDELDRIEADQGVKVPDQYRRFLEVAGAGAGSLWKGSDAFYPAVLGIKNAAEELLIESGNPFELDADALVIIMHQGYQFFFLLGVGEDPPVFAYVEGEPGPERVAPSFSVFLRRAILETM